MQASIWLIVSSAFGNGWKRNSDLLLAIGLEGYFVLRGE